MAYTVTVLETSAIQSYIFASNRLSEAVGGSYLVEHTVKDLLSEALTSKGANVALNNWKDPNPSLNITSSTPYDAEILYIGGGNAAFVTKNEDVSKVVVRWVSSRLIALAPGLILLAAHATPENTTTPIRDGLREARNTLRALKERGDVGVRGEGLGVSRACATTGLAASFFDKGSEQERGQWLSAAATARRMAGVNSGKSSDYTLPDGYDLTTDLEQLGGRPGDAHIAVVHCDGNNMGKRFEAILEADAPDDEIVRRLRGLSLAVTAAGQAAMQHTINALNAALTRKERSLNDRETGLSITRDKLTGVFSFPLRPIISGGDDVTWVCDGRIGLALAAMYLEAFAHHEGFEGERFAACAGVAICRTAFPLSRAYAVALSATSNAKKKAREVKNYDNATSWLDFSFIMSGIAGDISTKNERHNGPYLVTSTKDPLSAAPLWHDFANKVTALQTSLKRTQAKTLYDAVVRGEAAKNDALQQLELRLGSEKKGVPTWFVGAKGTQPTTTQLYDALMTFDFYLPILLDDAKTEDARDGVAVAA